MYCFVSNIRYIFVSTKQQRKVNVFVESEKTVIKLIFI